MRRRGSRRRGFPDICTSGSRRNHEPRKRESADPTLLLPRYSETLSRGCGEGTGKTINVVQERSTYDTEYPGSRSASTICRSALSSARNLNSAAYWIHHIQAQEICCILDCRLHTFSREPRMSIDNLLHRLAGRQFLHDELYRDPSAFYNRLTHHNIWVRYYVRLRQFCFPLAVPSY